jgi:hypothetical protein
MRPLKMTVLMLAVVACCAAQAAWGACVSKEEKKWATTGAPGYPWYEKSGIDAKGKDVDGIPAAEFDRDWVKASKLTMKMLPAAALKEFKTEGKREEYKSFLGLGDANFEIVKDLNADGKPEKVIAGVYKARKDGAGGFMAVVDPAAKPGKRVLAVFVYREKCNFSYLRLPGAEVTWWKCFECDKPQTLVWADGAFGLKVEERRDYDPDKTDNGIRQKEILR